MFAVTPIHLTNFGAILYAQPKVCRGFSLLIQRPTASGRQQVLRVKGRPLGHLPFAVHPIITTLHRLRLILRDHNGII